MSSFNSFRYNGNNLIPSPNGAERWDPANEVTVTNVITAFKIISTYFTALHGHYFQYTLLADFLSLSDTFDEHSLLRHHESEPSAASKETSVNRSRIMNNTSYAPLEYVSHHLSAWMFITTQWPWAINILSVLCDQSILVLFCIHLYINLISIVL